MHVQPRLHSEFQTSLSYIAVIYLRRKGGRGRREGREGKERKGRGGRRRDGLLKSHNVKRSE